MNNIGEIIGIEGTIAYVKLNVSLIDLNNIINIYLYLEDSDKKIVGEVEDVKDNVLKVSLLGEINNKRFVFGVAKKPKFDAKVSIVPTDEVKYIIGMSDYNERDYLYIGESPRYDTIPLGVSINSFFSNHFAIFGNTGSGKSCGVARLMQNLFNKKDVVAYRANMIIFDAYGEYHNAFRDINKIMPNLNFKAYTTDIHQTEIEKLKIPLWLLNVDDLAILLEADNSSQLPIIEKALKLVTIFGREEELVLKHKNDIIARALLDILASGKSSAQIRDQIFSVLSHYNTKDISLEAPVHQPGYTRPLKQCLLIDATGKIRDMELLTNFIESFTADNLELSLPDGSFKYGLKELYEALDFALISEGILKSEKVFDNYNVLKVRLYSLMTGDYSTYFDVEKHYTLQSFLQELLTADNGGKCQIINFNINYVDDRFAKSITKIFSRMFFEFAKGLKRRASIPFHIILEEAHRYVQNDNDVKLLGYNIFERITKEGRKYAVMLGLITQRPSELSPTTLSQCNNFLVFKMQHPTDVEYIKSMVPNVTEEVIKQIKTLQPGTCVAFGLGFKVPIQIKLKMPNPEPSSSSCDISNIWFVDVNK